MRRNILAYKAPPNNEGYDLICIHPDPQHKPTKQVLVQVKSRYATDCDRGFPIKEASFGSFDYVVVAFLNIGNFFRKTGASTSNGPESVEFYTLPAAVIKANHHKIGNWQKVKLRGKDELIAPYKNELGFELIAKDLGIPFPSRSLR